MLQAALFSPALEAVHILVDLSPEVLCCLPLWEDTKFCLESLSLYSELSLFEPNFDATTVGVGIGSFIGAIFFALVFGIAFLLDGLLDDVGLFTWQDPGASPRNLPGLF